MFISASKRDWNEKLSECVGSIELRFEPQQATRHFLWYTDAKQLYL